MNPFIENNRKRKPNGTPNVSPNKKHCSSVVDDQQQDLVVNKPNADGVKNVEKPIAVPKMQMPAYGGRKANVNQRAKSTHKEIVRHGWFANRSTSPVIISDDDENNQSKETTAETKSNDEVIVIHDSESSADEVEEHIPIICSKSARLEIEHPNEVIVSIADTNSCDNNVGLLEGRTLRKRIRQVCIPKIKTKPTIIFTDWISSSDSNDSSDSSSSSSSSESEKDNSSDSDYIYGE